MIREGIGVDLGPKSGKGPVIGIRSPGALDLTTGTKSTTEEAGTRSAPGLGMREIKIAAEKINSPERGSLVRDVTEGENLVRDVTNEGSLVTSMTKEGQGKTVGRIWAKKS